MVAEHLQFHYFLWGEKEEGVVAKTSPAPKTGKPALFCLKQGTACSLSCLKDGTASCLKDGTACSPEPQRWDSLLSPASKMGQPVISLSLASKTGQPAFSCLKDGTACYLSLLLQRWDSMLSSAPQMGQPALFCPKDGTACSLLPQRWDSLPSPSGQPALSCLKDGTALNSPPTKVGRPALSTLKHRTCCLLH